MTSKKGKKYNTKKNTESTQLLQGRIPKYIIKITRKGISMYNLWVLITGISVLLNFWFAYLALRPSVAIDYASHLIPNNPIALPIKVTNNGLLPIYNIICEMDINIHAVDGITLNNCYDVNSVANKLGSHKSIDYELHGIYINHIPKHGFIVVKIIYELPVIHKKLSESQRFNFYKSKDGYSRWVLAQ